MTRSVRRVASRAPAWTRHLRARGLLWAAPAAILAIVLASVAATWIAERPYFDHTGRVPAVTLGALVVAILATSTLARTDEQVEGSTPRPTPLAELATVLAIVAVSAALAVIALPVHPLERGGIELARNLAGLTGLALIGAALTGPRLGWLVPFIYTATSYFTVTRTYNSDPSQAVPGWIMFPATWQITHLTAATLLTLGIAAWSLVGTTPRPTRHPLR